MGAKPHPGSVDMPHSHAYHPALLLLGSTLKSAADLR